MFKSAFVVALGIFALAIVVDQQATASTAVEIEAVLDGGCPTGGGWSIVPAFFVIPGLDRGDYTDYNGDGWLCYRRPPGFCNNRGMGEGAPSCAAWILKDNDN
jgi:hypothetical protein